MATVTLSWTAVKQPGLSVLSNMSRTLDTSTLSLQQDRRSTTAHRTSSAKSRKLRPIRGKVETKWSSYLHELVLAWLRLHEGFLNPVFNRMLAPDVNAAVIRSFEELRTVVALEAELGNVDVLDVLQNSMLAWELFQAHNTRSLSSWTIDLDEGLQLSIVEVSQVGNFAWRPRERQKSPPGLPRNWHALILQIPRASRAANILWWLNHSLQAELAGFWLQNLENTWATFKNPDYKVEY